MYLDFHLPQPGRGDPLRVCQVLVELLLGVLVHRRPHVHKGILPLLLLIFMEFDLWLQLHLDLRRVAPMLLGVGVEVDLPGNLLVPPDKGLVVGAPEHFDGAGGKLLHVLDVGFDLMRLNCKLFKKL